jgi:hypothetical protein
MSLTFSKAFKMLFHGMKRFRSGMLALCLAGLFEEKARGGEAVLRNSELTLGPGVLLIFVHEYRPWISALGWLSSGIART